MIEKRAITIGGRFHLLKKLRKERNMEGIDLRHALYFARVVPVMRKRMMGVSDSSLGVDPVTRFPGKLKCRHPGDVSLKGQHLQLEH